MINVSKNVNARNHRSRWTLQEWRFLEKHYGKMTTDWIAESLGRSAISVRQTARALGCRKIKTMTPWTEAEIAILSTHYADGAGLHSVSQLLPGRNPKAIQAHAAKLGIQSGALRARLWNEDEVAILHEHYPKMGVKAADKLSGRTEDAVKLMANKLNIPYLGGTIHGARQQIWSAQEWQYLIAHVHLSPSQLLEHFPGRTVTSIAKAKERLRKKTKKQ